jgi:hypothetical protein
VIRSCSITLQEGKTGSSAIRHAPKNWGWLGGIAGHETAGDAALAQLG